MEITEESGKVKARIRTCSKYDDELLTMVNGFQWCGQIMRPELARLTIIVLTEYLEFIEQEKARNDAGNPDGEYHLQNVLSGKFLLTIAPIGRST